MSAGGAWWLWWQWRRCVCACRCMRWRMPVCLLVFGRKGRGPHACANAMVGRADVEVAGWPRWILVSLRVPSCLGTGMLVPQCRANIDAQKRCGAAAALLRRCQNRQQPASFHIRQYHFTSETGHNCGLVRTCDGPSIEGDYGHGRSHPSQTGHIRTGGTTPLSCVRLTPMRSTDSIASHTAISGADASQSCSRRASLPGQGEGAKACEDAEGARGCQNW